MNVVLMTDAEWLAKYGEKRLPGGAHEPTPMGANLYAAFENPEGTKPFWIVLQTLTEEAFHEYAKIYEPELFLNHEWVDLDEAVAALGQIGLLRNLEENHGLTCFKFSDTFEGRLTVNDLLRGYSKERNDPYSRAYTGIWDEVLSNPEWLAMAQEGKLDFDTLWDIARYIMEDPLWNGKTRLEEEQLPVVEKILISHLEPAGNYDGNGIKVFSFP